jgi:hypothetical protein
LPAYVRFEWLLMEGLVLVLAVWQLVSVRRSIRRDREAAKARKDDGGVSGE